MPTLLKSTLALAAGLALALPAAAHDEFFVGTLSGAKEATPNASPGTGSVLLTVNDHDYTIRVQFSFSGLAGNVTSAHIHCCTTLAGTGTSGVATPTPTFTGMVPGVNLGVTAGSYDRMFDMLQAASYNSAFLNAPLHHGDVTLAFSSLISGIADGTAYLNLHTGSFPNGELRTFFTPSAVPEPGGWALMLGGLALAGVMGRRRAG